MTTSTCCSSPWASPATPHVHRLRRRVDGVIVISVDPHAAAVAEITRLSVPTSVIGLPSPGAASVRVDDVAGAAMATQHLLNLGHRRIGLIHGRSRRPVFVAERDRFTGFMNALTDAGIEADPAIRAPGSFTVAGGEQAMTDLLTHPDPPSAVFVLSDEMAFGALRALHRHGMRAGTDMSIIGYDDHVLADAHDLTTIHQPVADLGAYAATTLRRMLAGTAMPPGSRSATDQAADLAPPTDLAASADQPTDLAASADQSADVVLPVHLVARGSTGPFRR